MDEELILLAAIADWEDLQRRRRGAAGPQPVVTPSGTPANGYVIEAYPSPATFYVAEDGATFYVQET
jgi:hypothetical protein